MNESRFSDRAIIVAGLIIFVATLAAFVWLWFFSSRPDSQIYRSNEDLSTIDLSNLESKGKTLLDGLKNNAGIPIPEPIGKEGRTNPFAAL